MTVPQAPRSGLPLVAGVLLLVAGIGAVIIGLGILLLAVGFPGGPSALIGLLALAFGGAQIAASIGIRNRQTWAVPLGMALAAVAVLASLAGLVTAVTTPPSPFDDPGVRRFVLPVIPLLAYGFILWALLTGRRSRD